MCLDAIRNSQHPMSGRSPRATSPSGERGRVVAEGQQRAGTAAARHAGPRRATRVLHRAPLFSTRGGTERTQLIV
jgi:hypothetical protein